MQLEFAPSLFCILSYTSWFRILKLHYLLFLILHPPPLVPNFSKSVQDRERQTQWGYEIHPGQDQSPKRTTQSYVIYPQVGRAGCFAVIHFPKMVFWPHTHTHTHIQRILPLRCLPKEAGPDKRKWKQKRYNPHGTKHIKFFNTQRFFSATEKVQNKMWIAGEFYPTNKLIQHTSEVKWQNQESQAVPKFHY